MKVTKEQFKEWTMRITGKASDGDLNSEITKYAQEKELNGDQIDRLCNFVNVHMFNLMMNDNKVTENKYVQFKTAQPDEIKATLNMKSSEPVPVTAVKQAQFINMSELWNHVSFDVFTEEVLEKKASLPIANKSTYTQVPTDKLNNLKNKLKKEASDKKEDWELACKIGNTANIGSLFERLSREMDLPYTNQKYGELYYKLPKLIDMVKEIVMEEKKCQVKL